MLANPSTLDPTNMKFEASAPGLVGQLPGEAPFKLDEHLKDNLLKAAASGLSGYLKVESGTWKDYYMSIDDKGWAHMTSNAQTTYVAVPYNANYYLVVASGKYSGYYLSYNVSSYVGAYSSWTNAVWWKVNTLDCPGYPGVYVFRRVGIGEPWVCINGIADKKDDLIKLIMS